MKKLILLFLLAVGIAAGARAQTAAVELMVKLIDDAGDGVPYVQTTLTDLETKSQEVSRTDSKGIARFGAYRNHKYAISAIDDDDLGTVEIPAGGASFLVKTVTYSPVQDMSSEVKQVDTIYQEIKSNEKPTATNAIVKIELMDVNKRRLPSMPVRIFSATLNALYVATTDGAGEATFLVPNGQKYILGVEDFDRFHTFSVPKSPGIGMVQQIKYQPTDVRETRVNDTIRQQFVSKPIPTSMRVLVNFAIVNFSHEPLADEEIYCTVENDSLVYCATTDADGHAQMLLPKGENYILNFKYERDIDKLVYPFQPGFHTTNIDYVYIGSRLIEEHYATAERDRNGFLRKFLEPTISPVAFDASLFKRKEHGYEVNFPREDLSAPLFADDRLFVSGGYYNPEFYSFYAESGKFVWGVRLSESGPSTAVYEDGVVLLITQSCTLYAIDALAGTLLWSRWLGPNLYSTPSIANGKVLAVYPDEVRIGQAQAADPFVLVAFDLHSGDIKWQNRIDAEVLASPVIYTDGIYLTTMAGSLYQFAEADGKPVAKILQTKAITAPTIVGDKMYVSLRSDKDAKRQSVHLFDRNGLVHLKEFAKLTGRTYFDSPHELSNVELMSHCGSRIVNADNRNYNIVDDNIICSSPTDGAVIWQAALPADTLVAGRHSEPIMPVVAGDKLVVSSPIGQILIYNAASGKLLQTISTGTRLFSPAVVNEGWIYSGSRSGKLLSINTGISDLSGWPTWCKDGSHNPVR